jgi:uncharacterized protein (DUF1697 family)
MPRAGPAGRTQTYVALLRGVNVGSRNKVSMTDLRALFASLGADEVTTYVQSGNVVFRARQRPEPDLRKAIEQRISRDLGLDVAVLLRTKTQLRRVHSGTPFAAHSDEPTKLHVTFLADTPARARVRALRSTPLGSEELRVVGREVYLYLPHGYGTTKLGNTYFEKELGVTATTRNWRTVSKLVELTGA